MRTILLVLLLLIIVSCRSQAPVHTRDAGAIGPYSSAVEFDGIVVLSGKIAGAEVRGGGDFAAEVESTLDAIEGQLQDLGLGLADVVSATVYLTDMARYGEFNELYAGRFRAPYPARVCVAVAALPGGAAVEVQVTARRP